MKNTFKLNLDFFKSVLGVQLKRVRANTNKVLHSVNPEFLHDLRVEVLRTGFVLKLFRELTDIDKNKKIKDRLKYARRTMGQARKFDVLSFRTENDFKSVEIAAVKKRQIQKVIGLKRAEVRRTLVCMLRSSWYSQMLTDLGSLLHIKTKKEGKDLRNDVKRRIIKLKRASFSSANFHKIRIALKELRYIYEFFSRYSHKRMNRTIRRIVILQDLLGEYRDAVSSIKILSQLEMSHQSLHLSRLLELESILAQKAKKRFKKVWGNNPFINGGFLLT